MRPVVYREGDRYGSLVVISEVDSVRTPGGSLQRRLSCRCDCGRMVVVRATAIRTGHTASCGCGIGTKRCFTLSEKFWRHVTKGDPGACWEWNGHRNKLGYGLTRINGKIRGAHRLSWIVHHGKIPAGVGVLHHCDNPPCVNPAHLFLGTNADNVRDMLNKGRGRKASGQQHGRYTKPWTNPVGVRNGRARLNEPAVRKIIADHASGETVVSIARRLGMSEGAIRHIVKGRHWKHLQSAGVAVAEAGKDNAA